MGFDLWSLDPFDITGKQSELSLFPEDKPLEDIRSEEQKATQKILYELAMTGSGGGLTLGTPYSGSLGSFTPTSYEQSGLEQLFRPTTNTALGTAESVFTQLAGAPFDPSTLEPFRKAAVRSEGQALDRLAQSKAATGSRFGTGYGRDASSLIEGTELGIQQQLANLFMNQQGRSLSAATGLAGVGATQQNIAQQNLQNMFNYGALERKLKTQEAQTNYNEWNRQRNEELGRVNLLEQEANRNPYMGFSTVPGYSALTELLKPVLSAATKTAMGGV